MFSALFKTQISRPLAELTTANCPKPAGASPGYPNLPAGQATEASVLQDCVRIGQ